MNKGTLYVVTGPSGTGKGTVLKKLFSELEGIFFSVSATTRKPRPGERDGIDYYFTDAGHFEEMIAAGELLEHARYAGNYYGTPIKPVNAQLDLGHDVILEIDLQGALQIKELCPQAVFVFIAPPSMEELERRLRTRGTEDEEHISMRLAKAREECASQGKFDFVVVNDEVERAAAEFENIIRKNRK